MLMPMSMSIQMLMPMCRWQDFQIAGIYGLQYKKNGMKIGIKMALKTEWHDSQNNFLIIVAGTCAYQ